MFGRKQDTYVPFGRRNTTQAPSPTPPAPAPQPRAEGRPQIIVPQSAVDAASPYDLVQAVVNFVNFALHEAYYTRDEVSASALRSFHVDYYLAQVNNGGHGQYAANSRMLQPALSDCQEGLAAMGHPAADIHGRFLDFSRDDPRRFRAVMEGGGFGAIDPQIESFDKAFYALNEQSSLVEANRAWVRSLPELKVVPDASYRAAMEVFAAANPAAATRKAERDQARRQSDARDPLKQALAYLCVMADQPREFKSWLQGQPGHDLGDGIKVIRFLVDTDKGICSAFFHPKLSVLFDETAKGSGPIARVPTEMVLSWVDERTGKNLFDVLQRG